MMRPVSKSCWMLALGACLGAGTVLAAQRVGWDLAPFGAARAAEEGHSGGAMAGGHGGHTDERHDHASGEESDHAGGKGKGARGGHETPGRGPDRGAGGDRAVEQRVLGGGAPVWAREGIPEVELGRLNVARAPGHVLDRARHEALSEYAAPMARLYSLSAEDAAALLAADYSAVLRIDSPLQNLALYKDVMTFGGVEMPGVDNNRLDLAAIFLGSASDKAIPVTEDTVTAVNRILGLVELDAHERALLAAKADAVRAGILAGHGDVLEH